MVNITPLITQTTITTEFAPTSTEQCSSLWQTSTFLCVSAL